MWKYVDLTGKKFGRLTVIERAPNHIQPNGRSVIMWKCKCDCGNMTTVRGDGLKSGATKSCGCWHLEVHQKQVKNLAGKIKNIIRMIYLANMELDIRLREKSLF